MNGSAGIHSQYQYREYSLSFDGVRFTYILDKTLRSRLVSSVTGFLTHAHPYYELLYLDEGRLLLSSEYGDIPLRPGQLCLIAPLTQHGRVYAEPDSLLYSFGFTFQRCGEGALLGALTELLAFDGAAILALPGEERYTWLRLDSARRLDSGLREAQIAGMLHTQFLSVLGRLEASGTLPGAYRRRLPGGEDSSREIADMYAIDKYLNTHFREALTEEALVREFHIGKRQLNGMIAALYGQSLKQRLISIRQSSAAYLLRTTVQSVEKIVQEVGYASVSNFSRTFRELYGVSPGEYRRECSAAKAKKEP